MIRPLAVIVAALLHLHPGMPREQAVQYATVMRDEARKRSFDPFTYVALAEEESHWQPGKEGDCDGEGNCQAIGLGQIHYEHIGACRADPEPVTNPGRECLRVRESLRDGVTNLRLMAAALSKARKLCQTKTGRALLADTLSAYGGRNKAPRMYCGRVYRPRLQRWVALPLYPGVQKVVQLRKALLRLRARPRRSR